MNPRASTHLIVIHCSATPPSMDIGAERIRTWHMDKGWSDIGYHFVIRRNGTIERGRDQSLEGAHAHGHNQDSIGICLVGGVDDLGKPDRNFTDAQFASLKTLVFGLVMEYRNVTRVCGHRDLPGVTKACPCFDAEDWFLDCRAESA